jgi:hypothetical protein
MMHLQRVALHESRFLANSQMDALRAWQTATLAGESRMQRRANGFLKGAAQSADANQNNSHEFFFA